MEPEDSLPCLQSLLWSQKIHYHVHTASSGTRRFIIMFTEPLMEPEDSVPCLLSTPVIPSALVISTDPFEVTGLDSSFQNSLFFVTSGAYWHRRLWSSGSGSSYSFSLMLLFHIFSFAALRCWRRCRQRETFNRNYKIDVTVAAYYLVSEAQERWALCEPWSRGTIEGHRQSSVRIMFIPNI